MDFLGIAKVAMELGVIPTLALFLVYAIHLQNRKLLDMVEKREQNNLELIRLLLAENVTTDKPRQTETPPNVSSKISRTRNGGMTVVRPDKQSLHEPNQFYAFITRLVEEGEKDIIVDMSETSFLNSIGIGEIIKSHQSVTNRGGKLVFANLTQRADEFLRVTHLEKVIKKYESVDQAVKTLTKDTSVAASR